MSLVFGESLAGGLLYLDLLYGVTLFFAFWLLYAYEFGLLLLASLPLGPII